MVETSREPALKSLRINIRNTGFSIPRPRSLGDFILSHKRWKLPDFKNTGALLRRVKINLLYFQTNYLIASLAVFAALM